MRAAYAVVGFSLLFSGSADAQVSGVSPGNLPGSMSTSAPSGADDAFDHDAVIAPDLHEPNFVKDHGTDYTPPPDLNKPKPSVTVVPVDPPPPPPAPPPR